MRKAFIFNRLVCRQWHCTSPVSMKAKVTSPLIVQKSWCHKHVNSANQLTTRVPDISPSLKKDQLIDELKQQKTFPEIMQLIEETKDQLNIELLETAFNKLAVAAIEQPLLAEQLKSEVIFQRLCEYSMKHIRQFRPKEVVNLMRMLSHLNVPVNSTLGQAGLQMARHYINDLSLNQIVVLDRILKNEPPNQLVDALKKALPLAFKIQIEYQLDPGNMKVVTNCLDMAILHEMDSSILEKLSAMILHHAEVLSKKQALKAAAAFSVLKDPFSHLKLKPVAKQVLARLGHLATELSPSEVEKLLLALRRNKFILSDSHLLSALSEKCISEDWNLQMTCLLLSVYNVHKFVSSSILDFILNKLKDNSTVFVEDETVNLITIFEAFSEANHKVDQDLFLELVQKCGHKINEIENKSPELLVKLAMHLAIMECLPPQLMERVFQREFIAKAIKSAAEKQLESSVLQCYLALEQTARLEFSSDYKGSFLSPDLIREAIKARAQFMKPIDMVLKEFLEVGLGGPQFLVSGLWTKLGHFIDHLVVMRKEDFPVTNKKQHHPLTAERDSEGFAFVEDLVLPDNAKVLAILVARREWFNRDPASLRGWTAFQQRTLGKMGYNPVIIGPPVENKDQIQDIDCRLESESY